MEFKVLSNSYTDYLMSLHELISYVITEKKPNKMQIDIQKCQKVYPIHYDELLLNTDLVCLSKNNKYDLNKQSDLHSLLFLYESDIRKAKYIISSIIDIINSCHMSTRQNIKNNTSSTNEIVVNKNNDKTDDDKYLLNDILEKISKKSSSFIPDMTENSSEKIFNLNNNDIDELINSPCSSNNSNSLCDSSIMNKNPHIELEKIRSSMDMLEKTQNVTKNAIDDMEDEVVTEEKKLSSYITEYNEDKKKLKKEEEEMNQKIDIYNADKETYQKIFSTINKYDDLFDHIPIMFNDKFPVFLFMDGKDMHGNDTREKILHTENEMMIFDTLYHSLIDDEYEILDDTADIISDFMNFLPNNYKVITQKEIMSYGNDQVNLNNILFKNNETEHDNCDEKENICYEPPK